MSQTIYGSLKGKSVLITDGASRIGESIARSFHAQGSKVTALNYNPEAGQTLAKELGEDVHFEHSDGRDIPTLQALSCLNVSSQFAQVHAALFSNIPSDTHLPLAPSD
jgi:NAD(P)-dependent dehydrogenase (short-subunit alcohol dehydrogenase family)